MITSNHIILYDIHDYFDIRNNNLEIVLFHADTSKYRSTLIIMTIWIFVVEFFFSQGIQQSWKKSEIRKET